MDQITEVVAAIICNSQREILFAQKSSTAQTNAHLWEFPGGKIKIGETPEKALIREIAEELSLPIIVESLFMSHLHKYSFGNIHLHAYLATCKSSEVQLHEHQKIVWLKKEKAQSLNFAPADIPIFQKLLITNWP
ncbi:MAG: (deoxy)nucleoside triphosphate pyrophosphohydrolase [Bdellovibrionales bacterium]|nr:(deoxy)nucleoside triphosphate pyrophosphohydrolase [Bdellovibrionales bacterium]